LPPYCGGGSFRDAVITENRVVIFDIAGTILINTPASVSARAVSQSSARFLRVHATLP
jgi:flagellar basal body P-ring protein FlgI